MTRHWTKLLLLAALASSPALAQISSRATSLRGWNICNPIGAKTAGFVLLWDGTNNCWKSSAASGISGGISGLTTNTIPKATSSTAIGDSAVADDGTNVTITGRKLLFSTDNANDIGASGATRPRDLFLGRNGTIGGTLGVTGVFTASGLANIMGDGTNTATSLSFAGGRAFVGYSGNEVMLNAGLSKGLLIKVNGTTGTFNTGTTVLYSDSSANLTTGVVNYIPTESGAANAIAGTLVNGTLATGLQVNILLAHTLQAGANTFALNGGGAVAIKSHRNTANNIATAYSSGGIISLIYDGTQWEDVSQ